MKHFLSAAVLAAATLASALPMAAHAAAYQSASFVDEGTTGGDYYLDNTRFLGAVFSVNGTESLSSIGGNFTTYSDGNAIFGAVVRLTAGGALPVDLASATVSEALFTPTGGEQSVALSGVLTSGQYAVVFGSGLFGATGTSGLVSGQAAIGTPTLVQYMDDGSGTLLPGSFTDDTLRVTMTTTPAVPEPASWVMAVAALLALGAIRHRRNHL